jgi:hypothetical protein
MLRRRKQKGIASPLIFVIVMASALFLVSCGGGSSTVKNPPPPPPPVGSYQFSVTASSSGYSTTPIPLTLNVQ